jgi:hypothetical protein
MTIFSQDNEERQQVTGDIHHAAAVLVIKLYIIKLAVWWG